MRSQVWAVYRIVGDFEFMVRLFWQYEDAFDWVELEADPEYKYYIYIKNIS